MYRLCQCKLRNTQYAVTIRIWRSENKKWFWLLSKEDEAVAEKNMTRTFGFGICSIRIGCISFDAIGAPGEEEEEDDLWWRGRCRSNLQSSMSDPDGNDLRVHNCDDDEWGNQRHSLMQNEKKSRKPDLYLLIKTGCVPESEPSAFTFILLLSASACYWKTETPLSSD